MVNVTQCLDDLKNLLSRNGYPRGIITYNMNDVVTRSRKKSKDAVTTVPKRDIFIVLPYLRFHSKVITQQLKSCIYKFYGFFNLRIIFRNTRRIKSFFPYKDRLSRSLMSKVVYKANCWDCDDFYIGKTKRQLHDRKLNILKHSRGVVTHQPLRIICLQRVTTLNLIILKF